MLRVLAPLALVALTVGSLGSEVCAPLAGTFRTQAGPCAEAPALVCNYGEIDGSLVGTYVFRMAAAAPAGPGAPLRTNYVGEVDYALAGGAMRGDDAGFFTADPQAPRFEKHVTFTGGDGAYGGARGGLVGGGPIDWTTGRAQGTYAGELCTPA